MRTVWLGAVVGVVGAVVAVPGVAHAGEIAFAPPVFVEAGYTPQGVVSGDVDGDGRLDLVVANRGEHAVSVLLGDGGGGFAFRRRDVPGGEYRTGGGFGRTIATGDLDGDGDVDLAVGFSISATRPGVAVLLNDGGRFTPAPDVVFGTSGDRAVGLAVADLDRDGKPDLVATTASEVWVLAGHGDGTFTATGTALTGEAMASAVGDLDGDGRVDLALAYRAGGGEVRAGGGDGTFGAPRPVAVTTDAVPVSLVIADFDVDGRPDLAAGGEYSVSVARNLGGGAFAPPRGFATPGSTYPLLAADLDADGRPDLTTSALYVLRNTTVVNRAPVAVDDVFSRPVWSTVLHVPAPGVLGNDTDPDGGPLSVRLVDGPRHGSVTLSADGSFRYRTRSPLSDDSFTYQAVDAAGAVSAPAVATIRVRR